MRRWWTALLAVLMLLGIHGAVWAFAGAEGRMLCQASPAACEAMTSGGACGCCGTSAALAKDLCRTPGSRCERPSEAGTLPGMLDQHRAVQGTEGHPAGDRESRPWPDSLTERPVDAYQADAHAPRDRGRPSEGGPQVRDRLAHFQLLRI